MIHTFVLCGLVVIALFTGKGRAVPQNPLTLRIYPAVSLSSPAHVRLTVRVEPHEDNRSVCLFIAPREEGNFERTSCWDTTPAHPPTTETWYWVPTGEYEAVAVLAQVAGSIQTRLAFQVGGGE